MYLVDVPMLVMNYSLLLMFPLADPYKKYEIHHRHVCIFTYRFDLSERWIELVFVHRIS